jgi:hypothetical protein
VRPLQIVDMSFEVDSWGFIEPLTLIFGIGIVEIRKAG